MPRKLTATVDEVNEQVHLLEDKIQAARDQVEESFRQQLANLQRTLRSEVQDVQDQVQQVQDSTVGPADTQKVADDAERRLLEVAEELRAEIKATTPPLKEEIQRTHQALDQKIADTDAAARTALAEELESLCANVDQELSALRESLEAQLGEQGEKIDAKITQQRSELDAALQALKEEATSATDEAAKVAAEQLQLAVEALENFDKQQDTKAKATQKDNEDKFEEVSQTIVRRAEEAQKALQESIEEAQKNLESERKETERELQQRDGQIEQLWSAVSDIENVPTRKVDWIVTHAASRMEHPTEAETLEGKLYNSWQSPLFDMAGARGLQLEFRYFAPGDEDGAVPPSPSKQKEKDQEGAKGNCCIALFAPVGTHVAFKFLLGKHEESFEHKFTASNKPFVSKRTCRFQDHLTPDDNLLIGLEIMECIAEKVKRCVKPENYVDEEGNEKPWLDSFFRVQRHVNNRVLDMVKTQLDYMKKRMTRRIEWRLEQASMMRKCFSKGAPMRSKEFDAAGIEGMQLHFYPSGYDSAGEGFCSLFLSAPAGTTLRCTLQVGPERKEVNHTFDKTGLCGKANFFRFDQAFDAEDCILVVLDIHEAHIDMVAKTSHPPHAAVGLRSFPKEAQPLVPLGSTIKLSRTTENLPDVLREVQVLPSLWAAKNRHDAEAKISDGLKPLKDTRKGRPKSGGLGPRSPSSPVLLAGGRRSPTGAVLLR